MTNQTNPAAPQTVRAREVIQAHLAVLDEWASQNGGTDGTLESISKEDAPTARWVGPQVARSALALKALLAAPEGAGRALAEAAEAFHAAIVEEEGPAKPWATSPRGRFLAALAAFRASPEAIGGGRADADDMRAQRDYNAATVVRTQMEWRKALLAITPPGVTWPESKPTEIATLAEATAEIGAAHAETRKALGHVRSNVKSIVAEREAIAKERDALRAERDRLAGDPRTELRWGLFGTLSGPPELLTAYRYEAAAKVREVEANRGGGRAYIFDFGAATDGPGANPKPAPAEAPREAASGVSERVRLIYEGAIALAAADQGEALAGHRQSAAFYAEQAVWIFRAAEAEAAKGGAA